MNIEMHEISIREITEGFIDNAEEGVVGFGGLLDIRPKYQREFVYDSEKRNAVIDTVRKNYPLNIMYWVKNSHESFEVLDGQQRTISICQYVQNEFSVEIDGYPKSFSNLTNDEKEQILDYKLMIYFCEGTDTEKLNWFEIINIAGEKLTKQELRNATFTGPWLTNAKSIFSKTRCAAYNLSKDYVKGSPIRQDILEVALKWRSQNNINQYMSDHQHDPNANELWTYFRNVIEWVELTFTTKRKEMKGLDWGSLYDQFNGQMYDSDILEDEIKQLMIDDDVTNKRGIYFYVLTRNEKYLNIRAFTPAQKRSAYERQDGICASCEQFFEIGQMEADHITPWHAGGKTNAENCKMLCVECNRRKSGV